VAAKRVHCRIAVEPLKNHISWRTFLIATFPLAVFLGAPALLLSRIEVPQYTIDLTDLAARASIIFRGRLLSISILPEQGNRVQGVARFQVQAVARFQVDRWYRNGGGADAAVYFQPANLAFRVPGHNCIDFAGTTQWLVFATENSGHLELADDCYGAATVSPLIDPGPPRNGFVAQMEADFSAGLEDPEHTGRLISIQRLGGLRSASSRPALHRIIESGNPVEVNWAVYAALRTGDTSILPRVRDLFIYSDFAAPLSFVDVALELRGLTDRSATASLIEIADSAPQPYARECALSALGQKIQAHESLPTMASHLTDPDSRVRFSALVGMGALTHEPSCTFPREPRWTEDMTEPQIRQCLVWWAQVGKLRYLHNQ
jgi:hypothetical protein